MRKRIPVLQSKTNTNTSVKGRLVESTNTLRNARSSLIICDHPWRAVGRGYTRLCGIVHEIVIRADVHTEFARFVGVVWA